MVKTFMLQSTCSTTPTQRIVPPVTLSVVHHYSLAPSWQQTVDIVPAPISVPCRFPPHHNPAPPCPGAIQPRCFPSLRHASKTNPILTMGDSFHGLYILLWHISLTNHKPARHAQVDLPRGHNLPWYYIHDVTWRWSLMPLAPSSHASGLNTVTRGIGVENGQLYLTGQPRPNWLAKRLFCLGENCLPGFHLFCEVCLQVVLWRVFDQQSTDSSSRAEAHDSEFVLILLEVRIFASQWSLFVKSAIFQS
jgi:hypothetical protein